MAFLVVFLLTETSFSEFTDFESGMLGQLLYYEEKNPPFKDKRKMIIPSVPRTIHKTRYTFLNSHFQLLAIITIPNIYFVIRLIKRSYRGKEYACK